VYQLKGGPIVAEPPHAVFLSYASQDTEAAQKICEALRAAGIEVFLDQSELRGGDVWDEKIRREINDCALFIPIISANTASRHEGYFRLEWDLADQRSHMMARSRVFVVPVCLDATTEAAADVPESFRRAQWTRLRAGETPPAFVERIQRLLSPEVSAATRSRRSTASVAVATVREPIQASRWAKPLLFAIVTLVAFAALAYILAHKLGVPKHATPDMTADASTTAAFAPPPHSIVVLPFVNLSGDASQDYFSDGLTEELLNSLAEIEGLQVAARTSSFSFKEHPDIATVAHRLNVGAVLEGSVRRSEHTVRVTAQLINAVTGFHLWSKTYDRALGDVLKLQTEIATAVANSLKVTLLGDVSAKIELGGTRNPAALDAYLRGTKAYITDGANDIQTAIDAYTEATRLDPNYALAFAARSSAITAYSADSASGAAIRDGYDKARADARQAIALAPELAEGYSALAKLLELASLDFAQASEAYERALKLAPGNAGVLDLYGRFSAYMGRADAGIAAARHAVTLDPLNPQIRRHLGYVLTATRRYDEAIAAHQEALALNPDSATDHAFLGVAYYLLGDLRNAQSSCEIERRNQWVEMCLALVYEKLGRRGDAEAALAKFMTGGGDDAGYQYATIYAQWGNIPKALEWLDKAVHRRDSGLEYLKTDPLIDPLRKEPRFQAIERALKFPE
jgi:TolB-like protein/Tfp pilus assembly protein PilF